MKVKVDATTNKRETNRKRDRVELIPSSPTSCDTVLGKIKKKRRGKAAGQEETKENADFLVRMEAKETARRAEIERKKKEAEQKKRINYAKNALAELKVHQLLAQGKKEEAKDALAAAKSMNKVRRAQAYLAVGATTWSTFWACLAVLCARRSIARRTWCS